MTDSKYIDLCTSEFCTGCFACESVCTKFAITKKQDDEGFSFPVIDHSLCVGCHACQKVCPVLNPVPKNKEGKVYASWINNDNIRKKSSSGGMFSAIALQIIKNGGVVVGASLQDDDFVKHIIVDNEEDLELLRGSKYVQSCVDRELYSSISKHLKENRKVLFCGTPCQTAALKSVFRNNENLFLVDLVCHGVPSPILFKQLLYHIRRDYKNFVSYSFRDTENWLVCSSVSVREKNKIIRKKLYGKYTFYQDAFLKGLLHRHSCYNCSYCSVCRVGDITLADFWGIGQKEAFSGDIKNGCSMTSVNSAKGLELFESIKNIISYTPRDIKETIEGGNEQLVVPSKLPKGRSSFYEDAFGFDIKKLVKKYDLSLIEDPNSFIIRVKRKISRILK